MIDIHTEQMRLLSRASHAIPGGPHTSTVIRWAIRGIRGVRLESVLVGGRRYTSLEAISRFLTRLNGPGGAASPGQPSAARKRELERVERQLDAERIR